MIFHPYHLYHFLFFDLGGWLVKLLMARASCIYDPSVRFFLGGGIINETHDKTNIIIDNDVQMKGWLIALGSGRIKVGSYSIIHPKTIIKAYNHVEIGKYCNIASEVYIEDHNSHPTDYLARREELLHPKELKQTNLVSKEIIIGDDVWIGRRAMIYKGVHVGSGAIIAAGAVVTHNVPAHSVAAGNPARAVKTLSNGKS